MTFRWRDLLAVVGLRARVRSVPPAPRPADPELAAARGTRVEMTATVDLLRLEAQNLGLEDVDADRPAG